MEINGEPDHVHILLEADTMTSPAELANVLKTQTARRARKLYGDTTLKKYYWKPYFWSDSYFITTTGGANIETLERYIQDQGIEKPKRKYTKRQAKENVKIPLHLILIYFLCRIHPRPTMSDEVFCGELDKHKA